MFHETIVIVYRTLVIVRRSGENETRPDHPFPLPVLPFCDLLCYNRLEGTDQP